MDGQELRAEMMKSLMLGIKNIAEERKTTNGTPYYIELGGRLDAMRTMLDYLMGVDTTPTAEEGPQTPEDDSSDVEEGAPV